jgi:hypothetical protein
MSAKPKNEKKIQIDLGLFLLITGALSNITLWIGAFVSTEAAGPIGTWVREILLPILGGISGLAMGITATFGLVYVLARLSQLKPTVDQKVRGTKRKYKTIPNPRFYTAWASIILLVIISPVLLGPYALMLITGKESVYAVLGDFWARPWSVFRVLAADLALGAVAMVYGVQLHTIAGAGRPARASRSATQSVAGATESPKTAPEVASAPESADGLRQCDVDGCEISYKWPNGKGAHFKKYHRDLLIQKGIPVGMSQPVNKK